MKNSWAPLPGRPAASRRHSPYGCRLKTPHRRLIFSLENSPQHDTFYLMSVSFFLELSWVRHMATSAITEITTMYHAGAIGLPVA